MLACGSPSLIDDVARRGILFSHVVISCTCSLVNTLPPGYSLNWGNAGDYGGDASGGPPGASLLSLTDTKGNEFKQICYDGEIQKT